MRTATGAASVSVSRTYVAHYTFGRNTGEIESERRERYNQNTMTTNDDLSELLAAAMAAQAHAYAPYSRFPVGAALRIAGTGEILSGCNVENVSYGATICAERNAISAAVARTGGAIADALVVVSNATPPVVPCALCLQVLQEFCPPSLVIHLANDGGIKRTVTLGELLPQPFSTFTAPEDRDVPASTPGSESQ